jgi:hypothetical protein
MMNAETLFSTYYDQLRQAEIERLKPFLNLVKMGIDRNEWTLTVPDHWTFRVEKNTEWGIWFLYDVPGDVDGIRELNAADATSAIFAMVNVAEEMFRHEDAPGS